MGLTLFETSCHVDAVSKYAHLTGSPSTGSIISRYVAFHISLHVASLILLTHELIVWSHFCREEDHGCVLGLKGDARAPRKIFERDGGKLQPPTTRCAKAVDAR